MGNVRVRLGGPDSSTGLLEGLHRPFKAVSTKNEEYEEYILSDLNTRIDREQQDYEEYIGSGFCAMSCRLPPAVTIPACGRLPDELLSDLVEDDLSDDDAEFIKRRSLPSAKPGESWLHNERGRFNLFSFIQNGLFSLSDIP